MPQVPRRRRRKRCPFCQTLLQPHPRQGARQWACAAPACQQALAAKWLKIIFVLWGRQVPYREEYHLALMARQ